MTDPLSKRLVSLAAVAMLATAIARADEVVIASDVLGPEGPLYVDGSLYYVGWTSNTLAKWDGKSTTVLNTRAGCGHNGLALTKRKTLLLACADAHGAIVELDLAGKVLRSWDADDKGNKFDGGINDVVVADNDGAYATVFGPYQELPTSVTGKILYLAPGAAKWVEVANDLNYANGIGISPDQKTLYVSETVGNCILKFDVERDGSLRHRSNFALLNLLTPNKHESWWLGPDSMKVDGSGNIYVAQWFGGEILKLSPDGKLLHVFPIAAGDGTTNVAFGPGEMDLYVSVVKDPIDPQAKGSIVKIPNVASDKTSELLGTWRGTSTCVDRVAAPGCHDEVVVYDFTKGATPGTVRWNADKVVDGQRLAMGELELTYDATEKCWIAEFRSPRSHTVWRLVIDGDHATGTGRQLPGKETVRRIDVRKDGQAAR